MAYSLSFEDNFMSKKEQEILSPEEILKERRKTLRNNLKTFGISPSEKLVSSDSLVTIEALKKIEELVPGLSYDRIISPEILGIISIIVRLPNLRSIFDVQIPPETEELTEKVRASLEKPSKKHYVLTEKEEKTQPIDDKEMERRKKELKSYLNTHREGIYIHEVGEWLQGQLNNMIGSPHIFLSDLIHPPAKENTDTKPAFVGTYSLSDEIGLGNTMGSNFERAIQELRLSGDVEHVCEEHLASPLKQIEEFLGQYDNPGDLVAAKLRVIRQKTQKYFPKNHTSEV